MSPGRELSAGKLRLMRITGFETIGKE